MHRGGQMWGVHTSTRPRLFIRPRTTHPHVCSFANAERLQGDPRALCSRRSLACSLRSARRSLLPQRVLALLPLCPAGPRSLHCLRRRAPLSTPALAARDLAPSHISARIREDRWKSAGDGGEGRRERPWHSRPDRVTLGRVGQHQLVHHFVRLLLRGVEVAELVKELHEGHLCSHHLR